MIEMLRNVVSAILAFLIVIGLGTLLTYIIVLNLLAPRGTCT